MLLGAVVLVASAVTAHAQAPGNQADHAIAMLGSPKYAPDFTHFDYVNPTAPKGGKLRLHTLGSFDSLNPYIVRGKPAVGVHHGAGIYFETLAKRSRDEPFTLYGLLAESITKPEDRAWVEFVLRPEAQFSDGSPVTVADVMFSWETLKTKGLPNARATWSRVAKVEATGERKIRFTFADGQDRELPLLVAGFMPILSKSWWATRTFNTTTLEPPLASGPYVIDAVDPGRAITYRRNPNYWGSRLAVNAGQHNFDEIRYDYFRDAGVDLAARGLRQRGGRFLQHCLQRRVRRDGAVPNRAVGHAATDGRQILDFSGETDLKPLQEAQTKFAQAHAAIHVRACLHHICNPSGCGRVEAHVGRSPSRSTVLLELAHVLEQLHQRRLG